MPLIVSIRRAALSDASALAELGGATFAATFGHLYPPEDLQVFLSESHSIDAWTCVLSDPERAVWIAVRSDGVPVAFIAVGPCKLPVVNREAAAGEVHQLYVLADHHNLRLGSKLMNAGLEWLEAQGRSPLYIGVWSENFGAQRFYERFGFTKVSEYGFRVGQTIDHEFILRR
jgi:diamine N-acetyltransferase